MRRGPFGREATGYRWRRGKGEPVSLGSSYGSGPAFCPETHMGGARVVAQFNGRKGKNVEVLKIIVKG